MTVDLATDAWMASIMTRVLACSVFIFGLAWAAVHALRILAKLAIDAVKDVLDHAAKRIDQ